MWRQYNRGERRTSLQNKPIHDLIGMRSEVGVVGIMVVICTTVFAISLILLPFLVSTVQRTTYGLRFLMLTHRGKEGRVKSANQIG